MTDFNLEERARAAYSEVAMVECEPNKAAWLAAIEAVGHDALQAAEDKVRAAIPGSQTIDGFDRAATLGLRQAADLISIVSVSRRRKGSR